MMMMLLRMSKSCVSKREREKKLCEVEEFLGEGHLCASFCLSLTRNCIQWHLTLEGEDHGNCITIFFVYLPLVYESFRQDQLHKFRGGDS